MPEFVRYIAWGIVFIAVALIGVCVFFYYIARCIIDRDDWDEAKTEQREEDDWEDYE